MPGSTSETSDDAVVFLHIPKTGGTSLHGLLLHGFSNDEVCPERFNALESVVDIGRFRFFSGHFDRASLDSIPRTKRIVTLLRDPRARLLSLYYFWRAHEPVPGSSVVDGPSLARDLSLLDFLRYPDHGIPETMDNLLTRTLFGRLSAPEFREPTFDRSGALESAKEFLLSMTAFGITEQFEASAAHITDALRVPLSPVIPHDLDSRVLADSPGYRRVDREPITPEIAEEIDRLTEFDRQLYEFATQRFAALRASR